MKQLCALCAATKPVKGCILCLCHSRKLELDVHRCTVYGCTARFLGSRALGWHLVMVHREIEVPIWASDETYEPPWLSGAVATT